MHWALAKTFCVKTDIWIEVHIFELGRRSFEQNKDFIATYSSVELYVIHSETFKITIWHNIILVAEIVFLI
jgi:hypothetical protein